VSLPLIVNPQAEADLAEAKAWYDVQDILCSTTGLNGPETPPVAPLRDVPPAETAAPGARAR
jgi:hypothetical protein